MSWTSATNTRADRAMALANGLSATGRYSGLLRAVPWLAYGRAGREEHSHPGAVDLDAAYIIDLHRFAGLTDFPCQPRPVVKRDPAGDLIEDRPELGDGHRGAAVGRRNVLDLQHGFLPCVGTTATIQRDEGTRLYLGDVIAELHPLAIAVGKDKRFVCMSLHSVEEDPERGVTMKIRLQGAGVNVHESVSIFQRLLRY